MVNEEQLLEIRQATYAITSRMFPEEYERAKLEALNIEYGVYRRLFDVDSVYRWIANKAREVFTVPVEKGHGKI